MLTTRERECLQGAADGLKIQAIANRLQISQKSVEAYLRECRWKLAAKNTAHAAAKAFVRGEIV